MNDYFILYANCIPVRGATRSVICDLHRETFDFIPDALFELLTQHKDKSIQEIKTFYDSQYDDTIDEYFSFLKRKDYIYRCEPGLLNVFPQLNLEWKYPALITNAVFDFRSIPDYFSAALVHQLDAVGCRHIQFRVYEKLNLEVFIDSTCSFFDRSSINTIGICFPFSSDLKSCEIETLSSRYPRIADITFYNAPANQEGQEDLHTGMRVIHKSAPINSHQHCGVVSETFFAPNIPHFTESQLHNTCLNRKISIDENGDIKNCPSMKESFGNIHDTTLAEAMNKPGFKKYWNITKDQISVCRDCEFRHICTDCRAYLEEPEDDYSKPLKCGYNPYTCTWEEWSTHPLKQKAITLYNF